MYHYFSPLRTLFCLLFACVGLGCDSGKAQEAQSLDALGDKIKKHGEQLSDLIPSRDSLQKTSEEELQKTFAVEYRVVDLSNDVDSADLQRTLEALGKERWDCFSILQRVDGTRISCKRRPISALRAVLGAGGLSF